MAVNTVNEGSVYPGRDGSTALAGNPLSAFGGFPVMEEEQATGQTAAAAVVTAPGGQQSILIAGGVFLVLLVALMFAAKKLDGGEGSNFSNIKGSFYNVLIISLAAIVAIPVYKYIFAKFQVPGISAWVHAV